MNETDLVVCPNYYKNHYLSPLKSTKISSEPIAFFNLKNCIACDEEVGHDKKQGYKCDFCGYCVHKECINTNIPSRHTHPLKITAYWRLDFDDQSCCLCETRLARCSSKYVFYYCSQCSFRICFRCARKPLLVYLTKVHEHEVQQIPIKISFTCDACGLCSSGYPCVCLQCCFIIHKACISLPRVIYINRHNHRISYVRPLGLGKWTCGVCREHVNGECGAYSCLVCPFVASSKCATSREIWDGRELEGVPEEEEESKPFEVIDQNLIKHFSHEHNLMVSVASIRLKEDDLPCEEDKHCYACTLPIHSTLSYKCTQCDFILHDECANLPLKKRHMVSSWKLTLSTSHSLRNVFRCRVCQRYCTGFIYDNNGINTIDVRCASISDKFKHESHSHLLFVYLGQERCRGCDLVSSYHLRCYGEDDCGGFTLCFRCATLPTLIRHGYDDHPLSLCYGEQNVNSTYFCGICEQEAKSKSWFYKCNDCGSTLHTECVFNNLLHSRPGYSLGMASEEEFDLLPNNRLSRPICYSCGNRCKGDLVLNNKPNKNLFKCCSCGFY